MATSWAKRCTGTRSSDGQPCERWAIIGGTVCPAHGGSAPQTKAKAARNVATRKVEREARRMAVPVDIDATEGIVAAVKESAGRLAWAREWLNDLPGPPVQEIHVAGGGINVGEHVLHEIYRTWMKDHVTYCAAALRAGIEQKQLDFMMGVAAQLAGFARALLEAPELGLTWEQREAGRQVGGRLMLAMPVPTAA